MCPTPEIRPPSECHMVSQGGFLKVVTSKGKTEVVGWVCRPRARAPRLLCGAAVSKTGQPPEQAQSQLLAGPCAVTAASRA